MAATMANSYANGLLNGSRERRNSAKLKPETYQLPRDEQESLRLNEQHNFVQDFTNKQLIHSCIPVGHITKIADIACGTGVWLRDYASRHSGFHKVQLFGFDISSSQFPHVQSEDINFVAHDMTKPFAKEYHNTFDLVNIRLVVAAVPVADLEQTILNVLEILS
jgi:SAM-dependent methyltransferase